MIDILFFGLDGDRIGRKVVAFFIKNDINELKKFSNNIEEALLSIKKIAEEKGGKIIYCTGDSILFYGAIDPSFGDKMVEIFKKSTSQNASVGIGNSMTNAYLGLTLAKAQGGNKVVFYKGG